MTLISELMFKSYSSCLPSYTRPQANPPDVCWCKSLANQPRQPEGPDGVRKRLGRLLDKEIAQLEDGKNPAKLLKRGKLIARWAKAVNKISPSRCTPPEGKPSGADRCDDAPCPSEPDDVQPWERTAAVPLGVEAFRTAVAKELSLIRNKKENIP